MGKHKLIPLRFIDQEIEVSFDEPPVLTKKPGPPAGFVWGGKSFRVADVLSSWVDYGRRGRMSKNMKPAHLREAERRGSWGVGRFYFRVRCQDERIFDLYYDRAPKRAADRAGHWFLWREMTSPEG
ncbi:MAG: DUF6504 family protein [Anaerolineales bacterium]|jgi:hypothetical protein